jgi:fermentation-respiration switch protein FrsA (DUF1100 family)
MSPFPLRRALFLAATVLLLAGCSRLLFFPQREHVRTPADVGLAYEDVYFTAADGTVLHAWWLPAAKNPGPVEPRGTVLFLHGNAENVSTHLASVWWLPAAGYQVLLPDYRGYGQSGGEPRFPEVFDDIEAAYRWLEARPEVSDRPLFLLGQSLGGSLGAFAVGSGRIPRDRLAGVVLDSAFARYDWVARDVARQSWLTRLFQWPIAWSMPDGYDPLDVVADLSPVPLLLIHGRQDRIVPYRHAEALFAAAREPKSFLSFDGPHIGSLLDPENRQVLLDFFARPGDPGIRLPSGDPQPGQS